MKTARLAGNLPEELTEEILLKVPARYVFGLRRVCKSWNALIITPQFASKHFNANNKKDNHDQMLFMCYCRRLSRKSLSLFSLSQPQSPHTLFCIHDAWVGLRLDFPENFNFPDLFRECFFAGSINGIICISSFVESSLCRVSFRPWVVLWNPTINRWKLIPTPPDKPGDKTGDDKHVSISLAFDSQSNDYKIVRLVSIESDTLCTKSRIDMYSANQDSWIDVNQGMPISYSTSRFNSTVIVKGVPYWSVNYLEMVGYEFHQCFALLLPQTNSIAAVDPHTGSYKKIRYPPAVKNPLTYVLPFDFMDSLAVLTCLPRNYKNQMFRVYALDQTCDTWNQMYAFPQTLRQKRNISIIQCFEHAGKTIIVGWDHDRYRRHSILYDPTTDSLCHRIERDAFRPKWDESYRHVESLFSVNGMVPIPREEDNSNHERGHLFCTRRLGVLI